MEIITIHYETLINVLNKKFNKDIVSTDYQITSMQGGTLGNVSLIAGTANTANLEKIQYKVVKKVQKKWERYGDPNSWRREYDLYMSNLGHTFSNTFHWPICYQAEINTEQDEITLWLEYIEGLTGEQLSGDIYVQAAQELGRYQGKLYAEQHEVLKSITNLSSIDLMKKTYLHYRSWPIVYDYIRSEECEFPLHVRKMLIDFDHQAEELLARIEKLPLVLCHRDFWINNLIYANGQILVIDWDTAGWGFMGEDLASLIADEADIDHMVEYYQRCVPAYYKGFSEHADVPPIANNCVYEMILFIFGYRLVEWFLHSKQEESKAEYLKTFEKIYEIKNNPL